MPDGALNPFLAFVWQPQDLNRAVMDVSRSTTAAAIFDLSTQDPREWTAALKSAGAVHVKISPAAFLDSDLHNIVAEAGIQTLWVEFHPVLFPGDAAIFLNRLRELKDLCRVVPISGDFAFLRQMVGALSPPRPSPLRAPRPPAR